MRRSILWLLLLCFSTAIVQSQESAIWTMRLYDSGNGTITLQSPNATIDRINLPVPADMVDELRFSRGISLSDDGTRAAYSLAGVDSAGARRTRFIVAELGTAAILLQYDPPSFGDDNFFFTGNRNLFNDSGTAIAYGYVEAPSQTPAWNVIVFDIQTNSILFQLRSDNPAMTAQMPQPPAPFVMPVIQRYDGARIDFTIVPWFTESGSNNPSFRWDVLTGRINTTTAYPDPSSDTLALTGETLQTLVDDRLPTSNVPSFGLPSNTVQVYDPEIDGRFPFVTSATLNFVDAWFIEGGERILLRTADLSTDSGGLRWWIAERDGTLLAAPAFQPHENVIVTMPDGFAYTSAPEGGQAELVIVTLAETQLSEQRIILQSVAVPVWVASTTPIEPDLPEWGQVAPPIFPEVVVVPTATPLTQGVAPSDLQVATPFGTGVLTVNGVGIINTTDGDRLNMRNQAGLASSVIARLDAGTRVTLLEGPVARDGFVWWRVRLATGIDGWVVESADGVATLIPQN